MAIESRLLRRQGALDDSFAVLEAALDIIEQTQDRSLELLILVERCRALWDKGDRRATQLAAEQLLQVLRASGDIPATVDLPARVQIGSCVASSSSVLEFWICSKPGGPKSRRWVRSNRLAMLTT